MNVLWVEGNVCDSIVGALSRVEPHVDLGLVAAIGSIPSALHEERADGRVMADLFPVDGTPVQQPVEGLPQNGVEWLVHLYVGICDAESKSHAIFEPVHWVALLDCFLEQERGKAEGLAQ